MLDNLNPKLAGVVVTKGGRIVAIGSHGPFLVSDDRGKSWSRIWITRGRDFLEITTSKDRTILWAIATTDAGNVGEIYSSRDEGRTWKLLPAQLDFRPRSISVSDDGEEFWVGGAGGRVIHGRSDLVKFDAAMNLGGDEDVTKVKRLKSGDLMVIGKRGLIAIKRNGKDSIERPACGRSSDLLVIAEDSNSGRIWAGGKDNVLCVSEDRGETWKAKSIGTGQDDILSLFYAQKIDKIIAGGDSGWIAAKGQGDADWKMVNADAVQTTVHYFADDVDGNAVYAAGSNGEIYRADSVAMIWELITSVEEQKILNGLAVSADGQRVFAVGMDALRVSLDAGVHWENYSGKGIAFFSADCDAAGNVAYAGGEGGKLYRWEASANGWADEHLNVTSDEIRFVWVSRNGETVIVVDSLGKVFRKSAESLHWEQMKIPSEIGRLSKIAANKDGSFIAAIGDKDYFLTSVDHGVTWVPHKGPGIGSLTAIGFDGDTIWVAGVDKVSRTSNVGGEWSSYKFPYVQGSYLNILDTPTYLWFVGDTSVIFTVDNGLSCSVLDTQAAAYKLKAGRAAENGSLLWFITSGGEILQARPTSIVFPSITSYKLPNRLTEGENEILLNFSQSDACLGDALVIKMLLEKSNSNISFSLKSTIKWENAQSGKLSFIIPPDTPRSDINLRLDTDCAGQFYRVYTFPSPKFKEWYEFVPGGLNTLIAVFVFVFFPVVMLGLYVFKPVALMSVREFIGFLKLPPPFNLILNVLERYLLIRYLLYSSRVLDAWVAKVMPRFLDNWNNHSFVKNNEVYIPMAVKCSDKTGKNFKFSEPHPEDFSNLLGNSKVALTIMGIGGIGKTTLAAKISSWLLDGRLLSHRSLPIPLDRKVVDMQSSIEAAVKGLLDDLCPDSDFLNSLMRQRRIVPIFDRVSEQDELTQSLIEKTYSHLPAIRLCIFTTRRVIDLDAYVLCIQPEAIHSATTLSRYMEDEIERLDSTQTFSTVSSRMLLISELAHTLENDDDGIITPLLATMFVEIVLKSHGDLGVRDSFFPETTAEIYLKYFFHTVNSGRDAKIPYELLITVGRLLADLSVGQDYAPRPFTYESAIEVVKSVVGDKSREVLDIIIGSGVLTAQNRLGKTYLLFLIDTLAQILSAYKVLGDIGLSQEKFDVFAATLSSDNAAKEYFRLLSMVRSAMLKPF